MTDHRTDLNGAASSPGSGLELAPGSTLPLDDPGAMWRVAGGTVDLFAELRAESGAVLWRHHLLSVPAGGAVLPLPAPEDRLRVLASGRRGAVLRRLGGARPDEADDALVAAVDGWLVRLSDTLGRLAPAIDYAEEALRPGGRVELGNGQRIAGKDGIVWARFEAAEVDFLDLAHVAAGGDRALLPLSSRTWLVARSEVSVAGRGSGELARDGSWWPALARFHRLASDLLLRHLEAAWRDEQQRLAGKASALARDRDAVLARFRAVFDRRAGFHPEAASPLLAACRRIGDSLGVAVEAPAEVEGAALSPAAEIEEIARRSRLRTRQVVLRHRWWRQESGPMLAFRRDDGEPVALLPARRGRVPLWAPEAPGPRPVTSEVAAGIHPVAYSFYRSLPDRRLGPGDLLRFAASVCRRDLLAAVACGALGALLALLVPIATAVIIDVSIPTHQRGQLLLVALALSVAAIAGFCFKVSENVAVLRVKGHVKRALEPAILDRLLRMPSRFFRRYSAGDLAQRTMTVALIQSQLTGGVLSTLLAGVLSLANFAVMVYLQPAAAAVAMLVLAGLAAASLWAVYRQQGALASTQRLRGKLASLALQMVAGIRRVRFTGAEGRFFVRWGNLFMELREAFVEAYRVRVSFLAFAGGYQILAFAVVFAALALFAGDAMTTGAFLAFLAAFGLAMTAFVQMSRTLVDLAELAPMYHRVRPLLEGLPEDERRRAHPGRLSGRLEIHELWFRYGAETPWILEGASLSVEAGESVAIVGSSGCGKSTLLRLALGFEQPTSGSIYFDGKDLASLDPRAVRRQIGVVLQQDRLMEATLFENIRGASEISVEDAWRAARLAGIAADIEAMPMGMHTVISAEGADLSGGQAQRLLIARALAGRPRILLLDEATSALDNKAQATVVESLERLRVTRIAVAHRLSTVKRADRIFVLDRGRVADSGRFDELVDAGGTFAELVRRQLK